MITHPSGARTPACSVDTRVDKVWNKKLPPNESNAHVKTKAINQFPKEGLLEEGLLEEGQSA